MQNLSESRTSQIQAKQKSSMWYRFLSYKVVPGDIDKVMKDQTNFAYNRKITMQPYVIIDGDTLSKIRTAYLVVDTIEYELLTLWKAFDTSS
ncbi:hypothetical protein JTB14_027902 [Gonioctena quinquepunctata]|nr:hypothetical protein JTB14_027902 [Gonioctena quinquepunctata]